MAWTLADLLAHMTAQHHGFAAAALGDGEELAHWRVHPLGNDPVGRYTEAADAVLAAFATVDRPDRPFVLPEFGTTQPFPADRAIGLHLIDYVVHSWDVARSLGLGYDPGPDHLPLRSAVEELTSRTPPLRNSTSLLSR
ncbi:TIGR03086 family metal-binding protein [Streptomyces sp. NPDC056411]|uniref:TIGR03086 family metal-binding protein n=1 Tax=Streptomyces sp. NPDC056411 TaxID=3345813 RepID=UPI0035E1686F